MTQSHQSNEDDVPQIRVQPGERLAERYLVQRIIGWGGMGVVVAARHEELDQTVAIKLLSVPTAFETEGNARFVREARAAASLRGEHITRVMDAGMDSLGRRYIVMEFLQGQDLAAVLREHAALPINDVVGYVLQTCEAVAEAHAQGIIHRDLKLENIFLTKRLDGTPLIKVLDFGISKVASTHATPQDFSLSGKSLMGSPPYMSPEQIRTPAKIGPRADIWALGVIMYELLTRKPPFTGESSADTLAAVLTNQPVPVATLRPDVPAALAEVVHACLEKDEDQRPASVGAVARSLHPWAPRWARDASRRAARMAGMETHSSQPAVVLPGFGDGALALVSQTDHNAHHDGKGKARSSRKSLALALAMAALASVLLTVGAVAWTRQTRDRTEAAPPTVPVRAATTVRAPATVDPPVGASPANEQRPLEVRMSSFSPAPEKPLPAETFRTGISTRRRRVNQVQVPLPWPSSREPRPSRGDPLDGRQ